MPDSCRMLESAVSSLPRKSRTKPEHPLGWQLNTQPPFAPGCGRHSPAHGNTMKMQFEILRDRPRVSIRLTRDSVSAGDDCDAPHEKAIEMPSFKDPQALSNHLSAAYLPSVAGIGHTWDCLLNGTVVGTVSANGFNPKTREVQYDAENHVHFRYHSATY